MRNKNFMFSFVVEIWLLPLVRETTIPYYYIASIKVDSYWWDVLRFIYTRAKAKAKAASLQKGS